MFVDILFFFDKGRKIYEEFCITFINLWFKKKNFYEILTQNNFHIFVNFTYFVNIWTLKFKCLYKKKLWLCFQYFSFVFVTLYYEPSIKCSSFFRLILILLNIYYFQIAYQYTNIMPIFNIILLLLLFKYVLSKFGKW